MDDVTDAELVKKIQKGDRKAFREIYDRYHEQLFYLAKKYVKQQQLAEDALQNIFLKFWRLRSQLDPTCSIKSFLFTMMKNHLLNMIRDRKNNIVSHYVQLEEEKVPVDNTIHDKINAEEYQEVLNQGIDKLSKAKREVFKLKVFQNYTNGQVARKRKVSLSTVKTQFYEGCKFIRTYLAKHADINSLFFMVFLHSWG
ncbi:MAG: RNA polymerase sigma-70 factor [Balneolaceae bacterium]|nr:RNA polymerase sigma-70 factor [Balneolaceae bacterium]